MQRASLALAAALGMVASAGTTTPRIIGGGFTGRTDSLRGTVGNLNEPAHATTRKERRAQYLAHCKDFAERNGTGRFYSGAKLARRGAAGTVGLARLK